jgi:hypothetical protein
VFLMGESKRRPGFFGDFVEGLVVDAVFAHLRMENARFTRGRNTRSEAEWEIYTDVLARFLGVDLVKLREKLAEERASCHDLQLCSNRIFFWAYRQAHPW